MSGIQGMLLIAAAVPVIAGSQTNGSASSAPAPLACHVEAPTVNNDTAAQTILRGYGTGGFAIKTASPEAQAYFDNGMQLAHAFAHRSAVAAFRRAERLDSSCAMCVWGEAWARGPSINFKIGDDTQAELASLADKAAALASGNPEREQKLIAALQKRYKNGGATGNGDEDYARAMDALADKYPDDNEIVILTADAWMIPASQNNTRDHLDHVIQILEAALQRSPEDTGAIHLYIHATENDGVSAEALPYAERLEVLAPAASHLVHMPSHVYFRLGRYREAEQSNLDAVALDYANAGRLKPKGGVFSLNYHNHNVLYGEAAALIDGDSREALSLASSVIQELATMRPEDLSKQFDLGPAYAVYGRYGSVTDVGALVDPGAAMPFAQGMWHYARGEAASRFKDVHAIKEEAGAIGLSAEQANKFQDSSVQAKAIVDIARLVLLGRAAMLENRWGDAEAAYRNAADIQETKLATASDPPAWWYPVRRSVAAALLAKGNPRAVMVEVQQALFQWPGDPITLRILAESEAALGQREDAQRQIRLAQKNWTGNLKAMPLSIM